MTSPDRYSAQAANDVVVFVHVPKAAGATLRKIMDNQYSENAVYRSDMHLYPTAFEEFRNLPAKQVSGIRCLIGHLPYGVHQFLPGQAKYVTILRNPVDRFLSKYAYLRNNKWVADQIGIENRHIETLESFIETQLERNALNFQTRQISGSIELDHCFPPFDNPMTSDDLETAKNNLRDEFVVVGLQEHFNASLLMMKQAFAWDNVYYHIQNVTSRPVPRKEIAPQTRELIARHNQLDMQLFEYGEELFAKQVEEYGPTLEKDLQEFERKNNRFVVRDTLWQKARMFKWKAEDFMNRCLGRSAS